MKVWSSRGSNLGPGPSHSAGAACHTVILYKLYNKTQEKDIKKDYEIAKMW